MSTRALHTNDVDQVVSIHLDSFKGFFLTELGFQFLKLYYQACIQEKSRSIGIGYFSEDGELLGFALGNTLSKGYYKMILKKNFLKFAVMGILILFRRLKSLVRLVRNMDKVKNDQDDGLYAELLSIGVHSSQAGKGVGQALLKEFEKAVIMKGATKIALTTDYEKNERVVNFYKKCGYQVFYEFVTYPNRKMYKLIKEVL